VTTLPALHRRDLLRGAAILAGAAFTGLPAFAEGLDAVTSIDGVALPASTFAGKVVLVVNVASFCGYTPQYTDLEALWTRYRAMA
jgi:hypothetical protein